MRGSLQHLTRKTETRRVVGAGIIPYVEIDVEIGIRPTVNDLCVIQIAVLDVGLLIDGEGIAAGGDHPETGGVARAVLEITAGAVKLDLVVGKGEACDGICIGQVNIVIRTRIIDQYISSRLNVREIEAVTARRYANRPPLPMIGGIGSNAAYVAVILTAASHIRKGVVAGIEHDSRSVRERGNCIPARRGEPGIRLAAELDDRSGVVALIGGGVPVGVQEPVDNTVLTVEDAFDYCLAGLTGRGVFVAVNALQHGGGNVNDDEQVVRRAELTRPVKVETVIVLTGEVGIGIILTVAKPVDDLCLIEVLDRGLTAGGSFDLDYGVIVVIGNILTAEGQGNIGFIIGVEAGHGGARCVMVVVGNAALRAGVSEVGADVARHARITGRIAFDVMLDIIRLLVFGRLSGRDVEGDRIIIGRIYNEAVNKVNGDGTGGSGGLHRGIAGSIDHGLDYALTGRGNAAVLIEHLDRTRVLVDAGDLQRARRGVVADVLGERINYLDVRGINEAVQRVDKGRCVARRHSGIARCDSGKRTRIDAGLTVEQYGVARNIVRGAHAVIGLEVVRRADGFGLCGSEVIRRFKTGTAAGAVVIDPVGRHAVGQEYHDPVRVGGGIPKLLRLHEARLVVGAGVLLNVEFDIASVAAPVAGDGGINIIGIADISLIER